MPTRLAGKCVSVATPLRPLNSCKYRPITSHWPKLSHSSRALSTESSDQDEQQAEIPRYPRWLVTPPRMIAPVRSKPPVPNNDFHINQSQQILDKAFGKVLGKNGHRMLPQEVMWLAVTHKSFDHGKRGYNDRLAFFGRRILNLQKSLVVVSGSSTTPTSAGPDRYGRVPFQHPALDGVRNLLGLANGGDGGHSEEIDDTRVLGGRQQLAYLADHYELIRVIRWKPKNAQKLKGSGRELITSHALLAIIGAIALHRGGDVVNTVVRDRILEPLRNAF